MYTRFFVVVGLFALLYILSTLHAAHKRLKRLIFAALSKAAGKLTTNAEKHAFSSVERKKYQARGILFFSSYQIAHQVDIDGKDRNANKIRTFPSQKRSDFIICPLYYYDYESSSKYSAVCTYDIYTCMIYARHFGENGLLQTDSILSYICYTSRVSKAELYSTRK